MYLRRTIQDTVLNLSKSFPVILLTGTRHVGKTTLLKHLAGITDSTRTYASMDDFAARSEATENPQRFLQRLGYPAVIDEIQHVPELLSYIKPIVDDQSQYGMYWLTGSQQFPLMKSVAESLAGRVAVLNLYGLSQLEESKQDTNLDAFRPDRVPSVQADRTLLTLDDIFKRILRGSYPRLIQDNPPPLDVFYGSYVQTYIERDIRSLLNISNLAAFQKFLRTCAARVGNLINFSDIARDVGISVSTAREWLHLLEATHQVYLLQPYFENINKRIVKTPKLYFMDTGLVCYLTGWRTAATAASGAMNGALLECYVVSEIIKSYRHRGSLPPLWFYRDKQNREVDLILYEDGKIFPIEIKSTATPKKKDLGSIQYLKQIFPTKIRHAALVCTTPNAFSMGDLVEAIPIDMIQ